MLYSPFHILSSLLKAIPDRTIFIKSVQYSFEKHITSLPKFYSIVQ